jgi:hypothetical protein
MQNKIPVKISDFTVVWAPDTTFTVVWAQDTQSGQVLIDSSGFTGA